MALEASVVGAIAIFRDDGLGFRHHLGQARMIMADWRAERAARTGESLHLLADAGMGLDVLGITCRDRIGWSARLGFE